MSPAAGPAARAPGLVRGPGAGAAARIPAVSEMRERMLAGEPYLASDPDLVAARARAQALLERLNATPHAEQRARSELLRELLGHLGEGVVVELPFRCDYGSQISIGEGTFVNFDC